MRLCPHHLDTASIVSPRSALGSKAVSGLAHRFHTTLNLGGSKNLSYPFFYQGLVHRYIRMHRVLCGRVYRVDLIYTWAEHTGLEPLASVLYHNHNETPTQMMSRKLFPYNFHRKENVRVQWSLTKITLFFSIIDSLFELFA